MTLQLSALLRGDLPAGIYRLRSSASSATIAAHVQQRGWRCFVLDGTAADSKAAFLQAASSAFAFPGYVGRNWDALEEAVNDLAWADAPGYVLVWDAAPVLAQAAPADWDVARAILEQAAATWQGLQRPFYVLLR